MLKALVERNEIDPHRIVEDVIFGCVDTIGPQAGDIARTCWLAAGLPRRSPGTTIDRQCGSSQQAIHFAAQAVMSGTNDVVIAGGVQNMNQIPISSAMTCAEPLGFTDPFSTSKGWVERYGTSGGLAVQSAEMIAEKWDISREDMEVFALESQHAGVQGHRRGSLQEGDRPLRRLRHRRDARAKSTLEKMATLKVLVEGGQAHRRRLRARTATPPRPLLIASEKAVKEHGLKPTGPHPPPERARRRSRVDAHRAHPATAYALEKTGMKIDDIDLVEMQRGLRAGGAGLAEGDGGRSRQGQRQRRRHRPRPPAGRHGCAPDDHAAPRARAYGRRYGLQTMCEGGGLANVTIIERL